VGFLFLKERQKLAFVSEIKKQKTQHRTSGVEVSKIAMDYHFGMHEQSE